MTITVDDWREFFPFPNVRDSQEIAINYILNEYAAGINDVVCQLPTGVGKSAIAVTVARYLSAHEDKLDVDFEPGAYILTTQKTLSKQYEDDFANDPLGKVVELKSSSNYVCSYQEQQTCGESRRVLLVLGKNAEGTDWKKHCTTQCAYLEAKRSFNESLLGVTNYSYFLAERAYVKKLKPRQLLVMDEAHSVDAEICKFVEIELSSKFAEKLEVPFVKGNDVTKIMSWASGKYRKAVKKRIAFVKEKLNDFAEGKAVGDELFKQLLKENDLLDKHICKLNRMISGYSQDDWIVDKEKRISKSGKTHYVIKFKPVEATRWAKDCLLDHGRRRLYMSATILSKDMFCRALGLDSSLVGYIELSSDFPAENRPVYYIPVGKMSLKESSKTLPLLADAVRQILSQYPDKKGIVHTSSFAVSKYIEENVLSDRLLCHDATNRESMLEKHLSSVEPTVLVSPSMCEGVSLDGDLSRFQIVAKLPFPSLADKTTRKKMEKDPKYYDFVTTRSFVQALGRSVRSKEDHAVTYVLDECFGFFSRKNSDLIPEYIKEAIKR